MQVQVLFGGNYQSTNPAYNIDIYGDSEEYSNDMYFQISLRPTEWKTIYFSQTRNIAASGATSYDPYVADLFYNGHSSDSTLAKVTFKLQQFGYNVAKVKVMNIFTTFGSIGGFSMAIAGLLASFKGIFISINKVREIAQKDGSGKCINLVTIIYKAILQLCGMHG